MFELTGTLPVLFGFSVIFGGALAIHSAGRLLLRWAGKWRPVFPVPNTESRSGSAFPMRVVMDVRSLLIGLGRVAVLLVVLANIIVWAVAIGVAALSATSFVRAMLVPL
ncbi:MAG: hypothetical protein VYB54_14330 [Pseudomonadota bacterium]|nr:hypothetical protein [Pseudomonadota bacterium]